MTAINVDVALRMAGMAEAQILINENKWQLWDCVESRPFGSSRTYVLYLTPRATWSMAPETVEAVQSKLGKGVSHALVVATSASLASDVARAVKDYGATSGRTVRELVQEGFGRSLTIKDEDLTLDHVFVDPRIQRPNGKKVYRARKSLAEWLASPNSGSKRMAALLAPAGVGKTTIAKQLTIDLYKSMHPAIIPLFINSDQWVRLPTNTSIALWDIWREAINAGYGATVNESDFEVYIESGLVIPIFDGFDELCTRYGTSFRAADTLDALARLLDESDGRLLITTRDTFWLDNVPQEIRKMIDEFVLMPFDMADKDSYLQQFFAKDKTKLEAAQHILGRLTAETSSAQDSAGGGTMTNLPLVISMAAESVDILGTAAPHGTAERYGAMIELVDDPIDGVLQMFMERERLRQQLTLTAKAQFDLFTELAFDLGYTFGVDQLTEYARTLCELPLLHEDLVKLRAHALLKAANGGRSFRYGFIADYLVARRLTEYLLEGNNLPLVHELCARNARGGNPIVERTAAGVVRKLPGNVDAGLREVWRHFGATASGPAMSGILHIVLKAQELKAPTADRQERTERVRHIIGISVNDPITDIHVEGVLRGLDLTDVVFRRCLFKQGGFAGARFNTGTQFDECSFTGGVLVQNCEGFSSATFLDNCTIDPPSWADIRSQQGKHNRIALTHDQLVATVRLALSRFQGPIGLRSITVDSRNRGPLAKSPIQAEVWEALRRHRVVEYHSLAGTGKDSGMNIVDDARSDVHQFLANGLVTGRVESAVAELARAIA